MYIYAIISLCVFCDSLYIIYIALLFIIDDSGIHICSEDFGGNDLGHPGTLGFPTHHQGCHRRDKASILAKSMRDFDFESLWGFYQPNTSQDHPSSKHLSDTYASLPVHSNFHSFHLEGGASSLYVASPPKKLQPPRSGLTQQRINQFKHQVLSAK